MSTLRHHARRTVLIVIAGLLGLSLFAPMVALADDGLGSGQSATVQTGGGDASLRDAPSSDAPVLSTVSDGTSVAILEGPVSGPDGSLWYVISAGALTGYVSADLVAGSDDSTLPETPEALDESSDSSVDESEEEAESAETAAPSLPWAEPIDTGVVVDNNNEPLPVDGLACRADAQVDASVTVRFAAGNSLEVTGKEVWAGDVSFLPVNCAGAGGFVRSDYVQLDSEAAVVEEPEEVVTEEAVTEEGASEDVTTDEQATEEAAAEDVTTDEQATEELAAEEDTSDEAATEEAASEDVTPEPATEEVATEEAVTAEATTEDAAEDVATEDLAAEQDTSGETATEETASEELAAEQDTTNDDAVADEDVTEEEATEDTATPEAVADEATIEAGATEEAATEEAATDESATEAVGTEEVTAEPATEEPATEEAITDESATEDATTPESLPAETATETEDVATEEAVTEVATTEAVATDGATKEAATRGPSTQPKPTKTAPTVAPTTVATVEPSKTVQAPVTTPPSGQRVRQRADQRSTQNTAVADVETAASDDAAAIEASQPRQQAASEQQASSRVDPALAIGTADVVGTNGDGVRCRTAASSDASTITVLAEGTTVQILSVERNGYLGVICGGQAGFANVEFLYSGGAGDEIAATAGSVTVVGAGGGLNCRSGAGLSNGVITVVRDGTTLSIRGASRNGWAPVVCGGRNGYVSIDYVEAAGSASSGSGTGGDVSAAAATMVVRGTNGDGVRCRTGGSTSSSIITVLAEGTRVSTRGSAMGGWVPVTCAGRSGYVSATYLGASGGSTSGGSTSGGSGSGVSSGWVTVTGTGGGGLRCRSSASTSGAIVMVVGEGRSMMVRRAASNGWQPVNCGGRNGYVSTQFITARSGSGSAPAPKPTPTPAPPPAASGMTSGDHAKVTDRLNLRYSASLGAGISTTIPAGTIVQVTGRATNGFYPVNWDGLKGYVSQDYIYKTSATLSKRGGSGSPSAPTAPPSGDAGSNATGNSMVSFALRYEGYPYIWASHGPSGFDCSGFTYWVTKNVTGKDIGYGLWTQVSAGTPVSRANLQPGDLVFFQNTYKAGLSHSGVYIGNNRFIHAENETTGVRISDLNSTYYGSRWYGAVRMT